MAFSWTVMVSNSMAFSSSGVSSTMSDGSHARAFQADHVVAALNPALADDHALARDPLAHANRVLQVHSKGAQIPIVDADERRPDVEDSGAVPTARAVARGHGTAVLAAVRDAGPGDLVIHNHPSGDLTPSEADLRVAAEILRGRRVNPDVVLKVVPSTDEVWRAALEEGLIEFFKQAGALVGNAGCAGCARSVNASPASKVLPEP